MLHLFLNSLCLVNILNMSALLSACHVDKLGSRAIFSLVIIDVYLRLHPTKVICFLHRDKRLRLHIGDILNNYNFC